MRQSKPIFKKSKILLISPPFLRLIGIGSHYPPLGLLYISSVLKNNKFLVKVYHADFQKKIRKIKEQNPKKIHSLYKRGLKCSKSVWEEIRNVVKKELPNIVGISFETSQYESSIKVAKIVKKIDKKTVVIVGGTHPTILPEETVKIPYFDIVVKGEGEQTMLELLNAIKNGKKLKTVKGILFKRNGKIIKTASREFIKNLDSIPFPARNSLIQEKSYPPYAMGMIITSRGCPYNCTFCCRIAKWKNTVRFRSPENVVNEIEEIYQQYGTREFKFFDDTFTLNKKRVIKICNLLNKRKLDVTWDCMTRVDLLSKDIIKKMKSSGCYHISFGIESGNQRMINNMKKGITLNQIRKTISLCKKEGIIVSTSFIIGYPGETEDTLEDTLNFIKELNPDELTILFATPYPGTVLYKNVCKNDIRKNNFSDYTNCIPIIKLRNVNENILWYFYEKMKKNNKKKKLSIFIKKIRGPYFIPKLKEVLT